MNTSNPTEFSIVDTIKALGRALQYIASKWAVVVIVGLVFGIAGVLYAWFRKPIYIAEMTFVAESEGKGALGMYAGIAAQFGLDLGQSSGGAFEGDNLIELLKSKTLIKKTLLTQGSTGNPLLIEEYVNLYELNKDWKKNEKYKNLKFEADPKTFVRVRDSIINNVYERITEDQLEIVKKDKKTSIITIDFKCNNEYFAKRFIEVLTNNAIQYYTEYKSKKARQNVEILQRQTDSVKRMLYGSISNVATLNDLNVNPIRQSVRVGSQWKQIDAQVNGTLYGELLKNLELAKLSLRRETPLIQVIDTPQLPLEKKKPGRIKMGLLFAIVGSVITAFFLLARHWVRVNKII